MCKNFDAVQANFIAEAFSSNIEDIINQIRDIYPLLTHRGMKSNIIRFMEKLSSPPPLKTAQSSNNFKILQTASIVSNNNPSVLPSLSSHSINFFSWNCNGFFSHLPDVQILIHEYSPKGIAFQEIHSLNNRTVFLHNHKIFTKCVSRQTKVKGRVLLTVYLSAYAEGRCRLHTLEETTWHLQHIPTT